MILCIFIALPDFFQQSTAVPSVALNHGRTNDEPRVRTELPSMNCISLPTLTKRPVGATQYFPTNKFSEVCESFCLDGFEKEKH